MFAYVFGMDSTLFSRETLLLAVLALSTSWTSLAQHAIWVDAVPVTRRLFGAAQEADMNLTTGWSSNNQDNGWRALVGFALSNESTDNFGTEVTTKNQGLALRAGYRWFSSSEADKQPRCRPVWGVDAITSREHIKTTSSNADFSSSFATTESNWGLSGVLGVNLMLAPKIHLVMETRLDGVYQAESTVQEDSFGGEFEQTNSGWKAQLNAPLSLFVSLGL